MENKRHVSVLIPYKVKNEKVLVFLQKRDGNAKVLPDHFSFFGGKIEPGEGVEEALKREIKEELGLTIEGYVFLGIYQSFFDVLVVLNVYFMKVDDNFEKTITVNEGEYGKFFSEQEVKDEPMLIDSDKIILKDLFNRIKANGKYA